MYNHIILAVFCLFCVLKIHVASKKFSANHIHKQVIKKKNSAVVEVSPQRYLIIAKQRFKRSCADAIEKIIIPSAWTSVSRPQIIAHSFKFLGERSEKFASAET